MNAAYPLAEADRLADLRRQSRQELRDLRSVGHDRRPGTAKRKKQRGNRSTRRAGRMWSRLIWLR